jgi:hypothetical protein
MAKKKRVNNTGSVSQLKDGGGWQPHGSRANMFAVITYQEIAARQTE